MIWVNINFIMQKQWVSGLGFLEQLQPNREQQRIPSVPLDFQYLPVEIISKEFTKLNSPHPHRIHYLGPRPNDTLAFHKRFGMQQHQQTISNQSNHLPTVQNRYTLNLQKIMACSSPGKHDLHYKTTLFYRAFEGMNPSLQLSDEFIFNGAFESGNLDCVIKVQTLQFDLFLRIDTNTRGHTGWYFFSIKNGHKKQRLTLNICNMRKRLSLYEQGLKPYVFSRKLYQKEGKSWSQAGQNCTFEESKLRYGIIYDRTSPSSTFKLSFEYEFAEQDDEVFFAYCVPYTYSQLQKDIQLYRSSAFVKVLSLERSLSGLEIPLLHITDHSAEPEVQSRKKCMVITGRVHPAQTNGSHMVRGFIEGLLAGSKESEKLKQQAHVFILPMLNPDGVVFGNTRTSAGGKDLNRQFIDPDPSLYPQCYHLKQFVTKLQKRWEVTFYFDFHGHSRRKNTFLYGPNYLLQHSEYYRCRLLPKMIDSIETTFRYYSCNFAIPEDKRSTARAVMLSQFKIPYVYTVESSIGLFYHPEIMKTLPLNSDYWLETGHRICQGTSAFNSLLIQFQYLSNQKMLDRGKSKQRTISSSGTRLKKKNDQDQFQHFVRCRKSTDSSPLLYGLLKQIKLSTITKPSENDSEGDSDEQDLEENIPSSKLNELRCLLEKQRIKYKQRLHKRICIEDEIDIIIPKISPDKVQKISNGENLAVNAAKMRQSSQRIAKQTGNIKITSMPHRGTRTLDVQIKSKGLTNPKQSIFNNRKSVQSAQTHSHSRQQFKPAHFHKQRYSLATKSLFPVQNKEEVLSLPKSLQVMRRQMKKGRLLIRNLEESRIKFASGGRSKQEECVQQRRKGPFNPVDPMKVRMVRRSSSSQVAYPDGEKVTDQHFMISATYNSLQGLEVDNLAMTIKTYKRR